jgi:PASTA domain
VVRDVAIALVTVALTTACGGHDTRPHGPQGFPLQAHVCGSVDDTATRGTTRVPRIKYGSSVDDAMSRLERASLCGQPPDVDFPHYVIGTEPAAGSIVERGTRVTLLIGDG